MKATSDIRSIFLTTFAILSLSVACNAQSVLSEGQWHKLSVKENGVYKISFDLFKKMGFSPASIDPRKIRIHGNPGGMLPQDNSIARPTDLNELAIKVTGEDDGKFDKQDFILFYGEGPDEVDFNTEKACFSYTNNLYSEENFYFITVGSSNGKRIAANVDAGAGTTISELDDFFFHETDTYNELHSGREWYGEKADGINDAIISISLPDVVPGSDVKVISEIAGQSFQTTTCKLVLNGTQIGSHAVDYIPSGIYSLKGVKARDTFEIAETFISGAQRSEHELRYQFIKAGSFSQGYVDRVLVSYKRKPKFLGSQQIFTSSQSLLSPVSRYNIETSESNPEVWDITDPANTASQQVTVSNGQVSFSATSGSLRNYIIFNQDIPSATLAGEVKNQNLHGLATPNLIIVTHPLFLEQAERLAAHREAESGWSVEVVTTTQVYNEFSSGRQDISAIRDFAKFLYDQGPSTLKAILLFGRGSYDYKNRVNNNTNFVPTYESRNSLEPLKTYASDDYFGFLEPGEGNWSESPVVNHSLDIGVGRLPCTTVEQATTVVDKIIYYEQQKKEHNPWRKKIVFVADDGNSEDEFDPLHQEQSNELATDIEETVPGIDTRKLFMGIYKKIVKPNGETVPEMEDDLVRAFNDGALIINFTGHGSEKLWTDERILSDAVLSELQNEVYPFLITATCEFGRNDDPFQTSSAESSVTHRNGGAIGIVTTTRPVNAFPNFALNQAFYEALFTIENNDYRPLGDVFRDTKNTSFSGVSNRNFMLLADPSLTIALPPNKIVITSAKTASGSDTLKALSTVTVKGEVQNANDEILTSFNGLVELVVYDKPTQFKTIGRNDPAFEFSQWYNILFRGKATVRDGSFEVKFILPKNISYTIAEARMSAYASAATLPHGKGSSTTIKIGGTEPDFGEDTTSPTIQAFVGDTTFIDGGITSTNTDLIVRLRDQSGINISDYGLGNSLTASLDDGVQTFVLNNYYVADTDTHSSGTVVFPLRNLTPGRHRITIKAWDVYNNPASGVVNFVVTEGNQVRIEEFGAYPNPASDKITLFFTHNSSGDDLEAQVFIYTPTGKLLFGIKEELNNAEYMTEIITLDNSDKKLPAGLYVARMVVRSVSNGSKNEQVTKLIILN